MGKSTAAFSHITLGTHDYERSATFYAAVLSPLGFSRILKPEGKPLLFAKDGEMPHLYLYKPFDGRPATWGNGTHVAFLAETVAEVDYFYKQALTQLGLSKRNPKKCPIIL